MPSPQTGSVVRCVASAGVGSARGDSAKVVVLVARSIGREVTGTEVVDVVEDAVADTANADVGTSKRRIDTKMRFTEKVPPRRIQETENSANW